MGSALANFKVYGKPNPEPYVLAEELLAKQAGLQRESSFGAIVAIGDNPKSDIAGANAAGGRCRISELLCLICPIHVFLKRGVCRRGMALAHLMGSQAIKSTAQSALVGMFPALLRVIKVKLTCLLAAVSLAVHLQRIGAGALF